MKIVFKDRSNSEISQICTKLDLKPFTIEEFNDRIDKSMEDSKNGRLTEANQLIAEIENWS